MGKCEIVKVGPLGFCFGVVRALKMAESALNQKKPIYLIGNLVHNHFVNEHLKSLGIIIKDDINKSKIIDEIEEGTVIFTAHGIDERVKRKASLKGLNIIDSTCPFVNKSFKLITDKINEGFEIIYLGKKNHPETVAAVAISSNIHLVETINDLDQLNIKAAKIALTNQTTMSPLDIETIESFALKKYPNLVIIEKACYATKERQVELSKAALNAKNENNVAFIVVGDKTSNNTKKLTETAYLLSQKEVFQVESINDLPFNKLAFFDKIYLTSGTSTPIKLVDDIYNFLLNYDETKQ